MRQKWALREEYKLVFQTNKKNKGIEHITPRDGLISGSDKLCRCSPGLRGAYTPDSHKRKDVTAILEF